MSLCHLPWCNFIWRDGIALAYEISWPGWNRTPKSPLLTPPVCLRTKIPVIDGKLASSDLARHRRHAWTTGVQARYVKLQAGVQGQQSSYTKLGLQFGLVVWGCSSSCCLGASVGSAVFLRPSLKLHTVIVCPLLQLRFECAAYPCILVRSLCLVNNTMPVSCSPDCHCYVQYVRSHGQASPLASNHAVALIITLCG